MILFVWHNVLLAMDSLLCLGSAHGDKLIDFVRRFGRLGRPNKPYPLLPPRRQDRERQSSNLDVSDGSRLLVPNGENAVDSQTIKLIEFNFRRC